MSDVKNPQRKAFFQHTLGVLKKGVSRQIDRKLTKALEGPVRPPGALDELEFLSTCTRCNACVEACPFGAIQKQPQSAGVAVGTPVLQAKIQPCHMCEDTPCIAACEPGALLPLAIETARMGRARVDEDQCMTYNDKVCTLCYDACPLPERAILIDPLFHPRVLNGCTGCGLCTYHCPTMPVSINVESPHQQRKRELEDSWF